MTDDAGRRLRAADSPFPSSLLVIRLSAFGDVIHTIPAVVALRDAMPQTEMRWAVEPPYAQLVELVAGVKAIPVSLKKWSLARISEAQGRVRGHRDSVDFQGLIKSALIGVASGARNRFGFARPFIREKPASLFINRPVRIDPTRHVVEWNLELAREVAPRIKEVPRVDFRPFAEDPTGKLDNLRGRVVLLPGAGRPRKQWPVEHFAELARRLGQDVLVAWGPGEESVARSIGAPVAPPTSFRELAFLLQHARLVVAADTGPLHLAAALGTPVIGLYGPTDPARNGPYGQLENVVSVYQADQAMASIAVDPVHGLILKINSR